MVITTGFPAWDLVYYRNESMNSLLLPYFREDSRQVEGFECLQRSVFGWEESLFLRETVRHLLESENLSPEDRNHYERVRLVFMELDLLIFDADEGMWPSGYGVHLSSPDEACGL